MSNGGAASDPVISVSIFNRWQLFVEALRDTADTDIVRLTCVRDMTITPMFASARLGVTCGDGVEVVLARAYSEHVVRTRAELTVVDARHHRDWVKRKSETDGMRSYFGKPVFWPHGQIFGTIDFLDREPRELDERTYRLIDKIHNLVEIDIACEMENVRSRLPSSD